MGARRTGEVMVLLARDREVDVRVEEAGEDVLALGLDHLAAALACARLRQLGDLSVADDHVVDPVDPRPGIEHGGAPEDEVAARAARAPPVERGDGPGRRHAGSLIGVGSITPLGPPDRSSGRGRPRVRSSYRIAIRTTRPLSTCSMIRELGPSITSPESSTPRFTGPGCMSSCLGLRRRESIW